jgi:hypothetical protein
MALFIRGRDDFINLDHVDKIWVDDSETRPELLAVFNEGTEQEFSESLGGFETVEEAEAWAMRNLPTLRPEPDLYLLAKELLREYKSRQSSLEVYPQAKRLAETLAQIEELRGIS